MLLEKFLTCFDVIYGIVNLGLPGVEIPIYYTGKQDLQGGFIIK